MKTHLVLLFLLFPFLLFAQSVRSLDDCIRLAWQRNPELQNSAIGVKESRLDYIAAVGSFLPRVEVSAEAGRNFGRSIDPTTNSYTHHTFNEGSVGLDMTLSLFEGFSRINRVKFERANRHYSEWEWKDQKNRLAYQVTDAYYKLLLEQKLFALAAEQSELSERYLRQTETFVELGLKSPADLREVQARCQGDIYRYEVRQNSCDLARLALKQLLNLAPEDTLMVEDLEDTEVLRASLVPFTGDLYMQSLAVMPASRMMDWRQQAARKEYAMAGGRFSPTVFARFGMSSWTSESFTARQLDNNLGKYLGIGISFPLLSGLERLTALRKRKLRIHRLQNEEELFRQQLYTEVEQTVLSLSSGEKQHRHALAQLQAERQVLQECERKWEEGLISVFELMEARNRFISAKAELARAYLQVEMSRRLENYYRTGSF